MDNPNTFLACALGNGHEVFFPPEQLLARHCDYSLASVAHTAEDEWRARAAASGVDLLLLTRARLTRPKRLLVMDFDSTLVTSEGLDLLAADYGVGEQVAAQTASAMRGELNFCQSLIARVALLAGMPVARVQQLAADQPIRPGMPELIHQARAAGAAIAIVSGGFHLCIAPIAERLGIHTTLCNRFDQQHDKLTGTVARPIIDARAKQQGLMALVQRLGLHPDQSVALGDGANDIPMLASAGVGLAVHPKPAVRQANPNALSNASPASLGWIFTLDTLPGSPG